jgi:tRNA (Thr-GGU) A37 N-methylase
MKDNSYRDGLSSAKQSDQIIIIYCIHMNNNNRPIIQLIKHAYTLDMLLFTN